jgi:hypothetical protein
MYTPKTFSQAQEVIGNYQELVQQHEATIDQLQQACTRHIAQALPYELAVFPPDLSRTCLIFTGDALEWTTPPLGNKGEYDRYIYEPLQSLHVDMATLPRNDMGEPMPLVCWRGVLWVPTVHYEGTMCDEQERLVAEGILAVVVVTKDEEAA